MFLHPVFAVGVHPNLPLMMLKGCTAQAHSNVLSMHNRVMDLSMEGFEGFRPNRLSSSLHSDGRGKSSALKSGVDKRVVFELGTRPSDGCAWPAEQPAAGCLAVAVPLAIRFYGPTNATLQRKGTRSLGRIKPWRIVPTCCTGKYTMESFSPADAVLRGIFSGGNESCCDKQLLFLKSVSGLIKTRAGQKRAAPPRAGSG